MRLHVSGVKLPKRGSSQDIVMREFQYLESEKEAKKTHLMALLVANSIPFDNPEASSEWEGKVKKVYNRYLELEFGIQLPEHTEKEVQMLEYYTKYVKSLRPSLHNENGKLSVKGLDSLNPKGLQK